MLLQHTRLSSLPVRSTTQRSPGLQSGITSRGTGVGGEPDRAVERYKISTLRTYGARCSRTDDSLESPGSKCA